MDELKRMVTGIGLMALATYLAVFGGVAMDGPMVEEFGFVLWLISPLVALPGLYYFVTVSPRSEGPDANTKP